MSFIDRIIDKVIDIYDAAKDIFEYSIDRIKGIEAAQYDVSSNIDIPVPIMIDDSYDWSNVVDDFDIRDLFPDFESGFY